MNIVAELGKGEDHFRSVLASKALINGRKREASEADGLREQVKKVWSYLKKYEIHDFQVCLSRSNDWTHKLMAFGPGDPSLSSAYPEKKRGLVRAMGKDVGLTDADRTA